MPYDPIWPTRFEAERSAIAEAIGEWMVCGVHHVGSTAVPELKAKHHLHLVPVDSKRYVDELAFRDRLREDAELARQYLALKRSLANRFASDARPIRTPSQTSSAAPFQPTSAMTRRRPTSSEAWVRSDP